LGSSLIYETEQFVSRWGIENGVTGGGLGNGRHGCAGCDFRALAGERGNTTQQQ
jgi:hypothetical protein